MITEIIAVLVALILWGYFTRSIWLDNNQNKEDDRKGDTGTRV